MSNVATKEDLSEAVRVLTWRIVAMLTLAALILIIFIVAALQSHGGG